MSKDNRGFVGFFRNNVFLILIVTLAVILRFYGLGNIPPSLNWDETAHGYNAYSILKTGKDEYGYKLPLFFRSFDDYKPPLYTYLVVPSVAIFGLNEFAVRFPSAFLGALAVLFTYLATYELFKNKKIALLAALFLAMSPWHVQFSRVAFETNSAIFWSVLGTWFFLKGINENSRKFAIYMSLAAIAFGANLYMYHNSRVFIPLYSMMLMIVFRKQLFKNLKQLLIPAIIVVFFIVPLIPIVTSISGQLRYKGTSIFTDEGLQHKAINQMDYDQERGQGLAGKIFHNRRVIHIPILIDNYLSHLRPTYLFFTADMNRHHAPEFGLMYLWDLPFILGGIYFLVKRDFNIKTKIILFWWFLIAPVASSVTWGVPHSLRSEIYLPTFQIFAALGAYTFYTYTKHKRLFTLVVSSLLLINFAYYLHQYYVHLPIEFSRDWIYGRKEAALYTESVKNNYEKIIVSTHLEQPHEFWLFYLKYDPVKYLKEGGTVSGGYLEDRNKFDKYFFKPFDFEKQKESNTLYVGVPEDFPKGTETIKIINYINGEPAIYFVKN